MRIRKRPFAATSSREPQLVQESSNGGLHLHAGSKSDPSFQDPRSSVLSPPSIIEQEHLLLAGSGYSATHRPSEKQLYAEERYLTRKPYNVGSSGVESCEDGKGNLMVRNGGRNPSTKSVMDVQHYEVKYMHMLDNDHDNVKDMDTKGCKELGLLSTSGEGDKLTEAVCKEARHEFACKGSALHKEINVHADPTVVDPSECYPCKVRPLQLVLSSDHSPTAPKVHLPLCPTSSSSNPSSMPPRPPCKLDKSSPCVPVKIPPFPSPAAGPLIKQIADVKSRDGMRLIVSHEDASRCNQNNGYTSLGNLGENRAHFESCGLLQNKSVSSWQGHRRPRSHVQGVRNFNGAPYVNAALEPMEQKRKKPKQAKRKAIDILVSPCTSLQAPTTTPATAVGTGELRKQDCCPAPNNNAHNKKMKNEPQVLLSPSAACGTSISSKMISSLAAPRLLEAKSAATTAAYACDDHIPLVARSPAAAAASDHGLELDSMRCRRNDGRGWQCKEQVVKAGATFCHYHTIKMREKHAASAARKLLKRLEGEMKISLSYADLIRSSNKRTNNGRKRRISPSSIAAQDGYDGRCKGREEANENDDEQKKTQAKLGKQQLQESLTLRRRWRKKCKPCIRRLHDIQDRARPAATDGLDFFNHCAQDTYKGSGPPVRSGSPLPECLLNTDPYEWRSDLP